ncbi:PREDICTED: mediator of RNA polymerase II transcription subunit 7-like [Acropora digitifera]|uniref:mediator of RNA polymerase II transcription subunit 7-like n=1 Tax=Acropora digitifera TaxID=70779 RepID=UPI00077A0E5C|nr:PREDICTED: mediator of RNA polymerase II transcription subunit 7-like [Acropora digitifera]
MAAEGVCPFPLPPAQYYKLYTNENVENKTAPEPPPPLNGSYSMFGASFEREEKLEDLNLLFINIHHLINELRPHQARETLRVMMERQKQQRLETADKLNKHVDRVAAMLQSCLSSLQIVSRQQDGLFEQMEIDESKSISEDDNEFSRKDEIMCSALEEIS